MNLDVKQQKVYIEHANLTVNDMKESINFFKFAFPHFKIRGGDDKLEEWIHLGDDYTYIAIQKVVADLGNKFIKNYDTIGINHIAFVVDDIEAVTERLQEGGFKRSYDKAVEKYRIRDYFADADGNEFEFIQYLSDKVEERNSFKD